jgi:hypothetical protein
VAWIFLGAFAVNLTTAGSLVSSLCIASGNTLEAVLGAYLVIRFANGRNVFDRARCRATTFFPSSATPTVGVAMSSPIGFREFSEDDLSQIYPNTFRPSTDKGGEAASYSVRRCCYPESEHVRPATQNLPRRISAETYKMNG